MILDLLKPLFSSKTRINILRTFFADPSQEMYIREITRATGEQINSIRRELESLEAIGLFSSKSKAGKKYFKINTGFIFYADFYSLFQKVNTPAFEITEALKKMSKKIDLIVLTGKFVEISEDDVPVDLFVVGDIQIIFPVNLKNSNADYRKKVDVLWNMQPITGSVNGLKTNYHPKLFFTDQIKNSKAEAVVGSKYVTDYDFLSPKNERGKIDFNDPIWSSEDSFIKERRKQMLKYLNDYYGISVE